MSKNSGVRGRVMHAVGVVALSLLLLGLSPAASAQYIQRYSTITNGAVSFTGNTLGLSKEANQNAPGGFHSIGTFISTNTALRDAAAWPFGTTANWQQNSSSAVLSIPAGSTVLYAELIWAGSYSYAGENVSAFLNNSVSFTTPSGSSTVSPDPATTRTLGSPSGGGCAGGPCFYVRSANVTTLVRNGGAGTYVVGGVPATQANNENNNNTAGWTLAVVYRNTTLPSRNLNVFVGSELTNGGLTTTAAISGFCTPASGTVSGRLMVSALEGDPQLTGDQMQIGPTVGTLAPISGPRNPLSNFFASQINDDNGALNTQGSFGTVNATPGDGAIGARQGYDITNLDASSRFVNGQTSAVVLGTSRADQYLITALGVQGNVGAPNFPVTVKSVDKAVASVGDTLTYTVRLDNRTGTAPATNVTAAA